MWKVSFSPPEHRLSLRIRGELTLAHTEKLADANSHALEATAGQPFRAFVDLRRVIPMEPTVVSFIAELKRIVATTPGFCGLVVLVDSPTVAMQQHRTRVRGRATPHELITLDEDEARRFLDARY
jgi:hypothetical protein